jgi:N-acetyl sugar amidotransferase
MTQCIQCLDDIKHPMGQIMNNSGLCTGCITHNEKGEIDWNKKWIKLEKKCQKIINNNRERYDCIVPLNGDAEDYYVVEQVLKLNLRPLLVYINNYFGTDLSWYNLHNLETHFDLDLITFNPNIAVYKEAIKTSLRKFNSVYWPYQAIKTAYPVRLALDMKIPLIVWGGLQATEQTGKFSHHDMVEMSGWGRVQHDLFGINEYDFFGTGAQISDRNQYNYTYPPIDQAKKIIGIYLSNYISWDPWKQNHNMIKYGFRPENSSRTFDQFERSGSSVFYKIHDILRYEKYGYIKVRDQLSREIRHGRIKKSDAYILYDKFLSSKVDISLFFKWLGSSKTGADLFIRNRLMKSSYLIGSNEKEIDLNFDIKFKYSFFSDGMGANKFFLNYYKGL